MIRAGLDHNRRFFQQPFLRHVDTITTGLTESAADAPVIDHQWSKKSGTINWLAGVIDFCSNLRELNRVLALCRAFADDDGLLKGVIALNLDRLRCEIKGHRSPAR